MLQLDLFPLSEYEAEELAIHADNNRFIKACNALKLAAMTISQSILERVDTQISLFKKLPVPVLTRNGWAW